MKLSLIIVNYNLCDLLRQNLNSLISAAKYIDYEVFIIDNSSTDKSVEMLQEYFPEVNIIANTVNMGMSKAYNHAIELSSGEYILLVSADTISGKETINRMVEFMDVHTDAAGTGVRMLSPQGKFLQESNRGLTNAWATFFKLIGFEKNLPKTRLINRNRKAWVEEFQTTEVDILNGAYMLLRKSALNEVGLFDERFVKYGYDIDLSYRMRLAGYKNYYFPKTYIINFKIQTEVKFSWQYIKDFYGAMLIFAMKYLFRMPEMKVQGIPQLYSSSYEIER
ncbi:MAG TPA: glycosyltransferase family 2 protein [Mucilaginibacter sp.]